MKHITPLHKEEIERRKEQKIDELIFLSGCAIFALTMLLVLSSWAR